MKEIYTPMEKVLLDGLAIHDRMVQALALDKLLLDLEATVGMMDGLPLEGEQQC